MLAAAVRTALAFILLAGAAAAQPLPLPPPPAPRPPRDQGPSTRQPAAKPLPERPATPPQAAAPASEPAPSELALPAEPQRGSNTGLALPRFAALRSDEVNFRTGPGTRYPIEWVYKRRDLPVVIEREFEVWRLVRDQEGVKGWVHQATLVGRRMVVVTGSERTLRREPGQGAAVALLKPGVIGRLRGCEASARWCEVQVQDHRGWLARDEFWGIYPGEAVH